MAELVNLRRRRKLKEREAKAADAAENRARFGQPKPARRQREGEAALTRRRLDGHRRDGQRRDGEPD